MNQDTQFFPHKIHAYSVRCGRRDSPKNVHCFNKKAFQEKPKPILVVSTTRRAGIELEMDSFEAGADVGVIAPLWNIGRWTDPAVDTPWNLESYNAILETE